MASTEYVALIILGRKSFIYENKILYIATYFKSVFVLLVSPESRGNFLSYFDKDFSQTGKRENVTYSMASHGKLLGTFDNSPN